MNVVDKLALLASDQGNEFEQVLRGKQDFNIINEKLHSLAQWLRLFMKSYTKYDYKLLRTGDIDQVTIELINYLSICNGILDVSDGLKVVTEKCFNNTPQIALEKVFGNTRDLNKEHDSHFKIKKNDKDYFKHIRAIFGQHPSYLKYPSNVKGFASWTFFSKNSILPYESDVYCNIYFDRDENAHGIKFHIFFSEIKDFVDTHIGYIEKLIEFIGNSIRMELQKSSGEVVGWHNELTLNEKIDLLKRELNKRYVIRDYNYLLEAILQLEVMLETDIQEIFPIEFLEYKKDISSSIDEIYSNVLNCEQNELDLYGVLDNKIWNAIGHGYYREKVSMFLLGDYKYHDMFKNVMDLACEKLNISPTHIPSDFYFMFYILSLKDMVAINHDDSYKPSQYTSNVILGIDAAWKVENPSGVCLLKDDSFKTEILRLSSSYDNFIKDIDDGTKPEGTMLKLEVLLDSCEKFVDCIAVDMPVSNKLISGRRSCEKKISKEYGNKGASTHSPTSERPGQISMDLVNQAEQMGYQLSLVNEVVEGNALIEVYPHASVIEYMNLDYRLTYKVDKKNKYKEWKQLEPNERTKKLIENLNKLIEYLQLRIPNAYKFLPLLNLDGDYRMWELKAYEDKIDAVFCALTGLNYISGNITGYGDSEGTIWVPFKK